MDHEDIINISRVGKRSDASKPRPLIVKFKNFSVRQKLLTNAGLLNVKWDNEIRPVYMSIDRTAIQREENKKLVDELRNRKQNGETHLIIRNNKIIQNFPREQPRTKVTWASLFRN